MARSSNMVIPEVLDRQFRLDFYDKTNIFNEASGGAIRLNMDTSYLSQFGGDFIEPLRFKSGSTAVQHSDTANPTTAITPTRLVQAKGKDVNFKDFVSFDWTYDEVTSGAYSDVDFSRAIGEKTAHDMQASFVSKGLGAAVAAVENVSAHVYEPYNATSTDGAKVKLTRVGLSRLVSKMGDAAPNIRTIVMHSSAWQDLMEDDLGNYVTDNVAGLFIVSGVGATMGRNIIVIDDASLISTRTSNYYGYTSVLGLADGAINITLVDETETISNVETRKEVLTWDVRKDYVGNMALQGLKWNTTANPTDTLLKTSGSWTTNYDNVKGSGIVKGVFNYTA